MSETSTSHTQWIQHAVTAAKAGNPSVAKMQLQKAAEANPEDPAIWLWMGWLADSPANAAQCLEIARSDVRFEKVAAAGIEFSKALAEFQLDPLPDPGCDVDHDVQNEGEEHNSANMNPVESVEEVVAVVESLQQEDITEEDTSEEPAITALDEATEEAEGQLVEDEPDETASEAEDIKALAEKIEDDAQVALNEVAAVEVDRPVSEVSEVVNEQPLEPELNNDVEAELMQAANELWQISDDVACEPLTASEDSDEDPDEALRINQQLWQTDEKKVDSVDAACSHSQADTNVESGVASGDERPAEELVDESEADFAFASEEEDEPTDSHHSAQPVEINRTIDSAEPTGDQWIGQNSVETPHEPVMRKAQSDWFSVDASSESEPERVPPSADTPPPLPTVEAPLVEGPEAGSLEDGDSVEVLPRVTASDIWQTAAIEKSAMMEAPAGQPPVYHPAVMSNAAQPNSDAGSLAESAPQSPAVASMADPSVFSGEPRIEPPPVDNRANSQDMKTVLVVDDSPTVRKLVAITLEKRGYKVVSAFDGVAAIKEIASHNPSLILMDVNMPRLDGYQLCKLVKKHETTSDIPVLMLTGKDGMFDRLRGRLVGCAGSLAKPFTPEELLEVVEQNIAQVK